MPSTVIGFTRTRLRLLHWPVALPWSLRHSANVSDRSILREHVSLPAGAALNLAEQSRRAAGGSPAATTVSAPSVTDWGGRPDPASARLRMAAFGMGCGDDGVLQQIRLTLWKRCSAPPNSRPMSDGVEWCCLNLDDDPVWSRLRHRDHVQEQLEGLIASIQLIAAWSASAGNLCGHRSHPVRARPPARAGAPQVDAPPFGPLPWRSPGTGGVFTAPLRRLVKLGLVRALGSLGRPGQESIPPEDVSELMTWHDWLW